MGKKQLAASSTRRTAVHRKGHCVILADRLKNIGYSEATRAGISIAIGDLTSPTSRRSC
jgi:hypothetical protein